MFNLSYFHRRPKFEQARESGMDIEKVNDEVMHNMCELNEKNTVAWSAGLNL